MCGIVACQTRRPALDYLLPALRRVEYRGYDSAGVAVHTHSDDVVRLRSVGPLASLEHRVAAHADGRTATLNGVGIGHTRWATHGTVSEQNSHPHVDCCGDVHVVHNGIIENAPELRADLELQGHVFSTSVDSETIAHLIERALAEGADLPDAVDKAVAQLEGAWALAVIRRGDPTVVLTAYRSPLLVGVGDDGAYAASDMTATAGFADEVQVIDNRDLVVLRAGTVTWRRADGTRSAPPAFSPGVSAYDVTLGSASDFMAKEIAEQRRSTAQIVSRLADGICDGSLWRDLGLPPLTRVRFVACGTSLNAASVLGRLVGRYGVPVTLGPASEMDGVAFEPNSTTIALSQSGETADVLRALEANAAGSPVLALTNVGSSTLGRNANALVELGVGPEIGVAATKTFSAQVMTGTAVLLSGLVYARRLDARVAQLLTDQLCDVPARIAEADELARAHCGGVVDSLLAAPGFLFLGRGAAVPYAAEGALKLKEITYRWADCLPAGELKHGPIALIEAGTPAIVVDDGHPKLPSNISEIRARQAAVLDVGGPGSALPYRLEAPADVPWGPLASVVVLQHLARELAVALGRDVDKPRNLAKSVTVE